MTNQTLGKIQKEIIDTKRDTRYKIHAYNFVIMGLDFYRTKAIGKTGFTGKELSIAFLEFANKQYGPIALKLLNNWGIKKTDDFGNIIFNLIDIKLVHRQKSDKLSDFFDIEDFNNYFSNRDYYKIDKEFVRSINGA